MDTGKYYKRQIEKAQEVLDDCGLGEFAEFTSRKLMQGEAAVAVAALYLCREAGDDRRGEFAQMQADAEQALDLIRAGHRNLSIIAAKLDILDIPGEGGR